MHVLVLGAAGMIGRKLTARLVADGRLGEVEAEMLAEIRDQLDIDRLHAAAIELATRARHRLP